MRLIDADTMEKQIKEYMNDHVNSPVKQTICHIILSMIGEENQIPIIDPVYAAGGCYCRKCKFAYINASSEKLGIVLCQYFTNRSKGARIIMRQNDFCSYGERREGREND